MNPRSSFADGTGINCPALLGDCPRCKGEGMLHRNPSPINDPQCAEDVTCPECEGTGAERNA